MYFLRLLFARHVRGVLSQLLYLTLSPFLSLSLSLYLSLSRYLSLHHTHTHTHTHAHTRTHTHTHTHSLIHTCVDLVHGAAGLKVPHVHSKTVYMSCIRLYVLYTIIACSGHVQGVFVFKAHTFLYHSALGARVIKDKKKEGGDLVHGAAGLEVPRVQHRLVHLLSQTHTLSHRPDPLSHKTLSFSLTHTLSLTLSPSHTPALSLTHTDLVHGAARLEVPRVEHRLVHLVRGFGVWGLGSGACGLSFFVLFLFLFFCVLRVWGCR